MQVTTIGLDLAKHWFQVHGVNASGEVIVRRKLRRTEVLAFFQSLAPCVVGMEDPCDGTPLDSRADQARP
jgi:transposase